MSLVGPQILTNASTQATTDVEELRLEVQHLESLLEFLDEEYEPMRQKSEELLRNSTVTFDVLWLLFPEGSEVIFKDQNSELKCAGKVNQPKIYYS